MKSSHFYSLERVPKPWENGFGTRYLVKLAVAGAVTVCKRLLNQAKDSNSTWSKPYFEL